MEVSFKIPTILNLIGSKCVNNTKPNFRSEYKMYHSYCLFIDALVINQHNKQFMQTMLHPLLSSYMKLLPCELDESIYVEVQTELISSHQF